MVEFKAKADKIIKERWGIEVEHVKGLLTYEQAFYRVLGGKKDLVKYMDGLFQEARIATAM